ncbi:MAG: hypothetical protein DRI90_16440 [Deltaproteobacteria bacterium]|nr:MAG: hypothetical protein DRI90_16440 [Deltaproteobacteria bacterium]
MTMGLQSDGDERPIEALFAALNDDINGPGDCNEGFHRPGAPLVTVFISDVDDVSSFDGLTSPPQWFSDLVAIKGDASLLATAGLLGPISLPDPSCPGTVDSGTNLRAFIEEHQLDRRAILNICEPSANNLEAAVQQIFGAVCPPSG